MWQTLLLNPSDAFIGLSHADRLALVFTALHNGLPATTATATTAATTTTTTTALSTSSLYSYWPSTPQTPEETRPESSKWARGDGKNPTQSPATSPDSRTPRTGRLPLRGEEGAIGRRVAQQDGCGEEEEDTRGEGEDGVPHDARPPGPKARATQFSGLEKGSAVFVDDERGDGASESRHRVIRGAVRASLVGRNVEALPVWGGLDAVAGSALLVDCRTPAQWRADGFQPTPQVRGNSIFFCCPPSEGAGQF